MMLSMINANKSEYKLSKQNKRKKNQAIHGGLQNSDTEADPQPPAWPLRESAGAGHFAFLESSDQERDHAFT